MHSRPFKDTRLGKTRERKPSTTVEPGYVGLASQARKNPKDRPKAGDLLQEQQTPPGRIPRVGDILVC